MAIFQSLSQVISFGSANPLCQLFFSSFTSLARFCLVEAFMIMRV